MWKIKVLDFIASGKKNSEQEQRIREYEFDTRSDAEAYIKVCNGFAAKLYDPAGEMIYEHVINLVAEFDQETQELPEW